MNQQPNFEKVKQVIYDHLINSKDMQISLLGAPFVSNKLQGVKKEINAILDRLDIRSVSNIITEHSNINLPKWIKLGNYIIDYNDKGVLDLISTERKCEC